MQAIVPCKPQKTARGFPAPLRGVPEKWAEQKASATPLGMTDRVLPRRIRHNPHRASRQSLSALSAAKHTLPYHTLHDMSTLTYRLFEWTVLRLRMVAQDDYPERWSHFETTGLIRMAYYEGESKSSTFRESAKHGPPAKPTARNSLFSLPGNLNTYQPTRTATKINSTMRNNISE